MDNTIILGIGHKARHGKDTVAEFIMNNYDNVHIIHWADPMYEHVRNPQRKYPLIKRIKNDAGCFYSLLKEVKTDLKNNSVTAEYDTFHQDEIPNCHKWFGNRTESVYWGMDEKDSLLLQFWGTDYRRNFYGEDFWVDIVTKRIQGLAEPGKPSIIVIADTRFPNEVKRLEELGGKFIKVHRYNEDGSFFVDPSRDPNHPSEVALNNVPAWREIHAISGQIATIYVMVQDLLSELGIYPATGVTNAA